MLRFHDMRHTFATLSLKSGVDVRNLSETLGHFSAGFTLSTYVHSTPGMKQSAADAIGNTIRNGLRGGGVRDAIGNTIETRSEA